MSDTYTITSSRGDCIETATGMRGQVEVTIVVRGGEIVALTERCGEVLERDATERCPITCQVCARRGL